jgi:tetrahydromethanopterin S-methyltransferase subunit G
MMSQFSTTAAISDQMKKYSELEKRYEKLSRRLDVVMKTLDDNDIKMKRVVITEAELLVAKKKLSKRMDKFEREVELKESKMLFRIAFSIVNSQ